jgi:hypothetical protein
MDDLAATWPATACSTAVALLPEPHPVKVSDQASPIVRTRTEEHRRINRCGSIMRLQIKAGVVEHPGKLDHTGLLFEGPPGQVALRLVIRQILYQTGPGTHQVQPIVSVYDSQQRKQKELIFLKHNLK